MQALILAAGMGKRIEKYSVIKPKCMIDVGGFSILERAVDAIKRAGIERLVLVVGHKSTLLTEFVNDRIKDLDICFIDNPIYETTNNIYTLYLAREEMIRDDTILLESDLVFENNLISSLCHEADTDMAVVDQYDPVWMDGTVVLLEKEKLISDFIPKKEINPKQIDEYYKTVNIYKFSKEFSRDIYMPALCHEIESGNVNLYYEAVLGKITEETGPYLAAFIMNGRKWYEIDNEDDLNAANALFL